MPPRMTQDMPAGSFSVGQHVRDPARGIDRPVHGVRVTPQGEFLQFSPGGAWLSAGKVESAPAASAGAPALSGTTAEELAAELEAAAKALRDAGGDPL